MKNSLQSTYPEIAKEWERDRNKKSAVEVAWDSTEVGWWKCRVCGHEWVDLVRNRTQKKSVCPFCKNKEAVKPATSVRIPLVSYKPDIAGEYNETKNERPVEEILWDSREIVWWRCEKCGHEWQETVQRRTTRGGACPNCRHRYKRYQKRYKKLSDLSKRYNTLQEQYPEIAKEWDTEKNGGLTPADVAPHAGKKVWWKCPRGHSYQATVSNRTGLGSGCKICFNHRGNAFKNEEGEYIGGLSLQELYPEIAKEYIQERNEKPVDKIPSDSKEYVWWRCGVCGLEWTAKVIQRTKYKTGCRRCSRYACYQHRKKAVRCKTTGKVYASIQDAHLDTGVDCGNIGATCRGYRKQAGGYEWEYIQKGENTPPLK